MNIILEGVVGSTAYGLAREGSDLDYLGVFIAPITEVAGLFWSAKDESQVTHKPDRSLHEIGKYLRLALKCNPTVMDLLWLPEYVTCTTAGQALVDLRKHFLSTEAVRSAYLGYASGQMERIMDRGYVERKTPKHARHMLRLLVQARDLFLTGELVVRVPDPEPYWAFDDMDVAQMLAVYQAARQETLEAMNNSVLLDKPDVERVVWTLDNVFRCEHYRGAELLKMVR